MNSLRDMTTEQIEAHNRRVREGRRGGGAAKSENAPRDDSERAKAMRSLFGSDLVLPYPPSANRFYRNVRGRMVMSAEGRAYKKRVAEMGGGVELEEGDVCLWLDFYRPRKSGDLDNRLKVVLDALQGIAYANDRQVVEIHARRYEDKDNPRVEITIT
jgi:crossover junction endodeoxyribonuclease RusA